MPPGSFFDLEPAVSIDVIETQGSLHALAQTLHHTPTNAQPRFLGSINFQLEPLRINLSSSGALRAL